MKALHAAAFLVALACATDAGQNKSYIRIYMERTSCFGSCPVYTVELREDGSVRYSGMSSVRVSGAHTWNIDPAAVRTLARDMERAGFFEMKEEYTAPETDMPTTLTTLTVGGRTKKITNYFSGPPALREIEARIDAVSGANGYIRLNAAAVREMRAKGWRATGDEAAAWMFRAVSSGDAETVKALLDAGANARAADGDGVTLVMRAAASGDPDTVRALLAAGGDPTVRDGSGRNAADRARDGLNDQRGGSRDVVQATGRPRDYALILKLLTDE